MICLCAKKLEPAGKLLAALNAAASASLDLGVNWPQLNLALALMLDLDVLPKLPALILKLPNLQIGKDVPPAAPIVAAGLAYFQFKAAFGIDLFDVNAQKQLDLLGKSLNSKSFLSLPTPSISLLNLNLALSAALNAKLALKLNLFDPVNLNAKLEEKLAPLKTAVPPALTLGANSPVFVAIGRLINLGLILKAAQFQFGIKLGDPKAASKLATGLSAIANLRLPAVQISLPKLSMQLAALNLAIAVKKELGLDLTDAKAAQKFHAALAAMAGIRLPTLPAFPPISLSGLKLGLALGMDPLTLKLDLSPLGKSLGTMPDFSGFSLVAALVLGLRMDFGLDLVAKAACSDLCHAL